MTAPGRTVTIPFFMAHLLGEMSFSPGHGLRGPKILPWTASSCSSRSRRFGATEQFRLDQGDPRRRFEADCQGSSRCPLHGLIVNFLVGGVRCDLGLGIRLLKLRRLCVHFHCPIRRPPQVTGPK
jgi:hypothetical protein